MKIVFLLTQDLESPSGLGRYYPLARELAVLGHNVTVYALHPNFDHVSPKERSTGNLKVVYVAPMHVRKSGNMKTYYNSNQLLWVAIRATWALFRAAIRERPDIIWVGKPHPMNSIAGILAKWRWGCRLYLDCDDDEAGSGNFQTATQQKIIEWFEATVPRSADCITINTFFTLEKMTRRGISREKLYYLPNGVDLERFATLPESGEIEALKSRLGLEGKQVISYIGSMSLANHAVDLLIDAFEIVLYDHTDLRLLLVGSGEDFEQLKLVTKAKGISDKVIFTGRVAPHEVSLYYRLSMVSVDPVYNNEAAKGRSPLKMFEAWACGVPFLTADVGDRSYLAGNPPAAVLVIPGNKSSLAQGLLSILDDSSTKETLINRGNQQIGQFTWSKLGEDIFFTMGKHALNTSGKLKS